ncbi:NAD(P)-binding protein [Apiospora saccharicola]
MAPKYSVETSADSIVAEFGSEVKGKVFLIMGVSPNGLGAFFAEALAKGSPQLLILASRDTAIPPRRKQ